VLLRDVVNWVVIVRTVVTPSAMRAGSEQNEKPGSSRARRDDMPPDGSSTVAKIAADLRPSTDASAVSTSLEAGSG